VIEGAVVTAINVQGQRMYQIAGGSVTETAVEKELEIPEEDVLLVAQQAGVSMERARVALEDAEGDLARAILMLTAG
ncbi:MAG: nascent polypeptide-associated complex protein, partial [Candidatus Bathyarchaeota archaeon]|nr:nascent polypeptide-associated complex protein [Candidatus Bathyarchaeota archaeon]